MDDECDHEDCDRIGKEEIVFKGKKLQFCPEHLKEFKELNEESE